MVLVTLGGSSSLDVLSFLLYLLLESVLEEISMDLALSELPCLGGLVLPPSLGLTLVFCQGNSNLYSSKTSQMVELPSVPMNG